MNLLHVTAGEPTGDKSHYPQICMLCKLIFKAICGDDARAQVGDDQEDLLGAISMTSDGVTTMSILAGFLPTFLPM